MDKAALLLLSLLAVLLTHCSAQYLVVGRPDNPKLHASKGGEVSLDFLRLSCEDQEFSFSRNLTESKVDREGCPATEWYLASGPCGLFGGPLIDFSEDCRLPWMSACAAASESARTGCQEYN